MESAHADDAAVGAEKCTKAYENRLNDASAVQYVGTDSGTGLPIDAAGLTSVLDAAGWLGIEPKRLRGYILRNDLDDPIGDADRVYPWSLLRTRTRLQRVST